MLRILFLLQQVFMVWMLVDAIRRRAEYHWFFVILLPFGEWIYFFMVKIHDPDMRAIAGLVKWSRPPTVAELRGRYELTPSVANQLALARGMHDAGQFEAGAAEFAALLARDPEDRDALYGRAMCRVGLKDWIGAIADLESLLRVDPGYLEYEVWLHLAKAHWKIGAQDEAFATLEDLCRRSTRINHALAHAQYLHEVGRDEKARALLEEALKDYGLAPRFIKRRDWNWSVKARKLLGALPPRRSAAA